MKPQLGRAFDPSWAGYPPAMPAGDYGIWQKYREGLIGRFSSVYFNVRVGDPIVFPTALPAEFVALTEAISRRRIDVVAFDAARWFLIELKYMAGTESLGQILMYKSLWLSDPPDALPLGLAIVTNRSNKDMVVACKDYNVEFIVVG